MDKPPMFGAIRFSCPHCGALAHQHWALTRQREVEKNWTPKEPQHPLASTYVLGISAADVLKKELDKKVTLFGDEDKANTQLIRNLHSSRCDSCGNIGIWIQEKLVYPANAPSGIANLDMPDDVKLLYDEAGAVFQTSPRASAALLRLALQLLLKELGEEGKNIDGDINKLIDKGLDADLSKLFHSVRIIGNEAVHPGEINVDDEPYMAEVMFDLLNQIVDQMISRPARNKALWEKMPENKRKPVEQKLAKRDKPK